MRNYAGTCKGICSYNLVYNVLIQLLPLKSLVFVVHFLNAFWHGNEAFPKGSSQNEIVPLLVIFHLPYSKYRGVKICFYQCHYQNQNCSLVSHSCRLCCNRVALVSFVQHSCRTRVTCVWRSCCKLDQIEIFTSLQKLSFFKSFVYVCSAQMLYLIVSTSTRKNCFTQFNCSIQLNNSHIINIFITLFN